MAVNKSQALKNKPQSSPKSGSRFKKVLIIFVLLLLAGVGFALGIYLKLINVNSVAGDIKLHQYPVIGQYFPQPKTNFETVEIDNSPVEKNVPLKMQEPLSAAQPVTNIIQADAEKQKQDKARQQEENKKISKLARLYENMKPSEAVAILNKMDDDTIIIVLNKMDEAQVAKILALFDSDRAARISQAMLKVKQQTIQ